MKFKQFGRYIRVLSQILLSVLESFIQRDLMSSPEQVKNSFYKAQGVALYVCSTFRGEKCSY